MNIKKSEPALADQEKIERMSFQKMQDVAINSFFESEIAENEATRIQLLNHGIQLGHLCYKLNPTLNCSRNISMCSLGLAELKKDLDEKVKHLKTALEFFDKAVVHLYKDPTSIKYFELLHLNGRLALMVATLPVEAHSKIMFLKRVSKLSLKDAVKCFEKAEKIHSGDVENQFYLAHCYELLKDYDSALMWFHEVTTGTTLTQSEKNLKEKALNKLPEEWK